MFGGLLNRRRSSTLLGALLFCVPFTVAAAELPTPGTVQAPLKRQTEMPPAPGAPAVEAPQAPPAAVPAGGPKILVTKFEISGNTAIPTAELHAVIAKYEGQRLTLQEIYQVADELTAYYRHKGYTLASATVPAQQVSSGVVRLQIVEGRVGKVIFDGNKSYSSALLGNYTQNLRGTVLRNEAIERDLLTINDLPGLSAKAVVTPGESYGTSDIVVQSTEKRYDASLGLDNYGRVSIGEWRVHGSADINNPFGLGDRLGVTLLHAEGGRLDYGRIDYSVPLGYRGTRLSAYYDRYGYNVDTAELGFPSGTLDGGGDDFGLQILHPLVRSRRNNFYLGLGSDRTITRQGGTLAANSGSTITVMRFLALYSHVHDDNAVTSATFTLSTNFQGNPSGLDQSAEAGKFEIDASHVRPLWGLWSLALNGTGVLSIDPLPDTERFRLGGPSSVRGYPSAEIAGDQGVFASIEARRDLVIAKIIPAQFRIFYDAGLVERKQPLAGESPTSSLTSAGVGLTARVAKHYGLDLEIVRPIGAHRVSDGRDDVRVWAGLTADF